MSYIQFRLAARTDAAGKYNESAPLEGNEDNMFVDSDLSNQVQGQFMADKVVDLSEKGCLMVVADGMGGMNAGEVASDIAIKTVMGFFAPERMSQKSFNNTQARINYLEEVVVAADAAIKADAQNNKEHEGMGSTLIMAWLCDGQVCITWCGDSRAYLFRPAVGFRQVSKDHSYVQGLVDEGKITEAEAFDHPYGNIITRSLGDPEKKAKPDSISFNVYQGDIIMLCSDGLSGVLRDHKTIINGERVDTENLEDLIRSNRATMAGCRDELFAAAERNDWYDNVTAILCEIVKGDPLPVSQAKPMPQASAAEPQVTYAPMPDPSAALGKKRSKALIPVIAIAAVLLLCVAGLLVYLFAIPKVSKEEQAFFANCKKANKIELYRSYLDLYPEGSFAKDANEWIKHYEDSIAQIAAPTGNQSIAENSQEIDGKGEKKEVPTKIEERNKKKELNEKEKNKKENDAEKKEGKVEVEEEVSSNPENNLSIDDEGFDDDPKGEGKNKDFSTKNLEEKSTKLTPAGVTPDVNNPRLAPVGNKSDNNDDTPDNFTPAGKTPAGNASDKSTSKKTGISDEEQAANDAKTIDRCCEFVKKYGDKSKYYSTVKKSFKSLYEIKLSKCKSVKDCEQFLKEHDKYMRAMHMNGSDDDRNWHNKAENKKKEFEDVKGVIKDGDPRPETKKVEIKNRIK